jgi:hypothetical protein
MSDTNLQQTVASFNLRRFTDAARHSAEGLNFAQGRDEVFWCGLHETCEGYALLVDGQLAPAEAKLVAAMQKLRNFGFQYNNFEVTGALAGIRLAVEESTSVEQEI